MTVCVEKRRAGRGARALLFGIGRRRRYKCRAMLQYHVDGGWGVWRALI